MYRILLVLSAAATLQAGILDPSHTLELNNSNDPVIFNGDTVQLGNTCHRGVCDFGGSDSFGRGYSLNWNFYTLQEDDITLDPSGDITGLTQGAFTITDGNDTLDATFTLTSWSYDGNPDRAGYQGVDLSGIITVTGVDLAGFHSFDFGNNRNNNNNSDRREFENLLYLPVATSYFFTLDVGDCSNGRHSSPCITNVDPDGNLQAFNMTPTPEPGTMGMLGLGLVALLAKRSWVWKPGR